MNDNPLTRLRIFIANSYSMEDFRLLCTDLTVLYDDLGGDERISTKADRLLYLIGQQRRYEDLLLVLRRTRAKGFVQGGFDELTPELLQDALPVYAGEQVVESGQSERKSNSSKAIVSDRYEIQEERGRGSFAVVYKALDTALDRPVALKVLHQYWQEAPEFIERFRFEAQTAAKLRHPNIVRMIDFGRDESGRLLIAMEFLPGQTLEKFLAESGAMDLVEALPILTQVASALDYAHRRKIIHRDLKPKNIMVERAAGDRLATLMDFGLVKAMEGSVAMTMHNSVFVGSVEYMSPEQADPNRSDEVGPASDRYALGILAYKMLTGRVPFFGNLASVLYAHEHKLPPMPREIQFDLPEFAETALLKMLSKQPKSRFSSCLDFVTALSGPRTSRADVLLAELYEQLLQATENKDWIEVLMVGGQIRGADPGYRNVSELITHARQALSRPSQSKLAPKSAERDTIVSPTPILIGDQTNYHNWQLPSLSEMLEAGSLLEFNNIQLREHVEIIEDTLDSFGVPGFVVEINQGPTITQYCVEPSFIEQRSGKQTKVKVGEIATLADDLALALSARSIRIQAPVPGKGYIGIEVPNTANAIVSLRDVMESEKFQNIRSPLRIGLGQSVSGHIAIDLTQMPHLLIAGTTWVDKSVCVNGIITCLLLQNTPENLKLVMVDPRRFELTGYDGIPHLFAPVVVNMEQVIDTLRWALREMDNRYQRLADIGAKNIVEYNKKAPGNSREKMTYIVIIIDELADLMMQIPEDTERSITRLAQMSHTTGIHMIIATQRPSVDVVTGLIKANFPARIAFAVASSTDSRVILDATGAERLLGQGDMLFQSPDAAAPVRMQGCFVNESELHNIIEYWHRARIQNRQEIMDRAKPDLEPESPAPPVPAPTGSAVEATTADQSPTTTPAKRETPQPRPKSTPPSAVPPPPVKEEKEELPPIVAASTRLEPSQTALWEELEEEMKKEEEEAEKYSDKLLPEAIALVRKLNKASTSLLQRRFRIGYTRAAQMMKVMEEDGIIGPPTGTSKVQEVLLPNWEGNEEEGY